jgi:hypothetical protein
MTTTRIDYATTYFPHSTPTPIRDEPTYKALKKLKSELKANASSVDSDMGGGDHGYLGLVLSDTEYARICPDSAFEPPEFPGKLQIPRNTETIDAINIREEHRNNLALYRECREVEMALLRYITTAIESKYIDFLSRRRYPYCSSISFFQLWKSTYARGQRKRTRGPQYTICTK